MLYDVTKWFNSKIVLNMGYTTAHWSVPLYLVFFIKVKLNFEEFFYNTMLNIIAYRYISVKNKMYFYQLNNTF